MFRRWFAPKSAPLTGAPVVRRQKTYSAQSGYVYQYFYAGHRPYGRPEGGGMEHVFEVSPDRKKSLAVSVLLGDQAVGAWETAHHRELNSTERYAIVKMALFQAFDERPQPEMMKQEIHVRTADIEGILASLDIE
ncbi:MAG TPA: hypothetical protein VG672_02990 [Bryobacteraceae bacterium]|nr:hypothetical protein [Bryobacteraceae bacterium]